MRYWPLLGEFTYSPPPPPPPPPPPKGPVTRACFGLMTSSWMLNFVLIFLFWLTKLDQFAIKSVVFCVWILLQNQYEIKYSMLPAKCALPCTKITWTEWLHIHICVCMDKMCNISRRNMLQVWYKAALASYQCDNKTHVFFSNNYKHYVYTAHLQVQMQ